MLMTFMCSPCFCILPTIWSWNILRLHNKLVKIIALSNTIQFYQIICCVCLGSHFEKIAVLLRNYVYHLDIMHHMEKRIHQMKVGWTLYLSNYPLPYLSTKSKKTCHKKCQHLLLRQYHMKTWQWKLVYKNWPQMFWKKTNRMFKPSFW